MSEMDWGGGHQAGAHCALHPEFLAQRTCVRCGNFMCATCTEGGTQSSCPTCRARLGSGREFPFRRDTWSFSGLWNYCFEIFKREWVMLSVSVLVFLGITLIAQLISNILPLVGEALGGQALSIVLTVASFFVQNVVQGVLGLGLMRMLFDVLHGRRADIGKLFSQLHKVWAYLGTLLLLFLAMIGVFVVLGGILFLIAVPGGALPSTFSDFSQVQWDSSRLILAGFVGLLSLPVLIYLFLPLYLLQAELAYEEHPSPMQALRNCYAYMRGQRLPVFGFSLVNGLVIFAGMLACCVGLLPALGLSYLLMAALYLSLRTGGDTHG
ncbi:hypothetical protein [Stigmatella aurantiaca]|uniref:Uncharacterized protein n=1 Tax=Stigmatella aurantiaca (strain DW4/3-1) TaxID=378806 RepID=Q099S3_STIAD|nr:hypothetical protein [Stigmatella aurantiaca]ADO75888.1 uncharacterized protein STAUR_8133 [Stigmatella aurantiaca DW4/3-1]EAU68482.1 hypothetical protein STIAU_3272 [Stigmatella aurantiaca DW4/3-1]